MTTKAKRITRTAPPAGAEYSRPAAEEVAGTLVALQCEREELVAKRDKAALAAAQPYAPQIDQLDAEIRHGLAVLEAWADYHPDEFPRDAESTLLAGHRVGWRLGNYAAKTLPKWTWAKVMEALREKPKDWRDRYLRVREDVNKEALVADREHAADLKTVGVQIVQERRFYLEPAREGQADTTLKTDRG